MTVPFYCVLAAFILNYLSKLPVAVAMQKEGGYDNRHPRDQQARLEGWGRRALAAHMNSFEVTPIFAVAVITAHIFQVPPESATMWSGVFLISRVAYHVLYMADIHLLRSTAWFAGIISAVALFILAM